MRFAIAPASLAHNVMWLVLSYKGAVFPVPGPGCLNLVRCPPNVSCESRSVILFACTLVRLTSIHSRIPLRVTGIPHHPFSTSRLCSSYLPPIVAAAVGLSKCGIFYFPDPFAIIMVDAGQGRMTSVIERTMDPYWSESFDL